MSRIKIVHTTTYRYAEPVAFGIHRLVVRPREGHDVQVENFSLRISPAGTVSWHRDIFGNSIALASFSEPSDFLEFSNEAIVFRRDHTSHRRLLDVLPVKLPVQYSSLEAPFALGYLESVYREETAGLRDWTMRTFAPKQGDDAVQLAGHYLANQDPTTCPALQFESSNLSQTSSVQRADPSVLCSFLSDMIFRFALK